ncbi:MAG TPA: DUF882 domain-containing protein [Roseiarcus sp.]|jgi:uncharacterized protein YcbK (DUF882 family)
MRLLAAPVLLSLGFTPSSTESAIANGDTRTIVLSNSHTNESGSFTYMVDGTYDSSVLDKLNWFLRDWRLNEPTKMDPKLFDIIWEVYRESGSAQPIDVLSGYRSPQTNAMLRRRSRLVAQHSEHMEGKAIDAHFVDVGTATIRDIAMRMEAGGVGFYPTGATPWVHIDSGSVRYWPRMNREALARLFPDGKTVFIPADGQPMPGYEQARAEIESRGGEVVTARAGNAGGNIFSWLFGARGGGADDEEESGGAETAAVGRGGRMPSGVTQVASETPDPVASAKRDLPRGATYMQPGEAAPQTVAANDADAQSGGGPVTLRGPIAAQFIAPTPPRKPAELAAGGLVEADTPTPPQRPAEFAFAPAPANGADRTANPDLIAALLQRGRLPGVITRGMRAAPPDVLALAEVGPPEPPARPSLLDQAAALDAPLPPSRPPVANGSSTAAKTVAAANPPAPAVPHELAMLSGQGGQPKAASPYGDLVFDGFAPTPQNFAGLRGSAP